jgi:hypothetical protein
MDKVIIENFRCFGARHEVPLAPLTVLVGENSTGKSTFLAAIRLAWDVAAPWAPVDFNEAPFLLGGYEEIATFHGGRAGRAKWFILGQEERLHLDHFSKHAVVRVEGRFIEHAGQPYLACVCLLVDQEPRIDIEGEPGGSPKVVVRAGDRSWELPRAPKELLPGTSWPATLYTLGLQLERARYRRGRRSKAAVPDSILDAAIEATARLVGRRSLRPYAFAPVRSRPQRTYDPIRDEPDPEGQHIPMVLARLLGDRDGRGADLVQALAAFGEASGLFSEVTVRKLGGVSDPFQVMVRSGRIKRNLIDVGYGVSQVLPILVEIATQPPGTIFLIQQPEVHLHPRAQAALATLFARLVRQRGCKLVVETHSDYFVDRLRMDVRDGKGLGVESISLLYFDRGESGMAIHPIRLDERGNIIKPPPSYRRFFLEEEHRFLGAS